MNNIKNLDKNNLCRQYEPLINKIVNQFYKNHKDYDLIRGGAEYGLVYAINTYDSNKNQSFTQYSAWCMRNFILNDLKEYSNVVKHEENSKYYDDVNNLMKNKSSDDDSIDKCIDMKIISDNIRNLIESKYPKSVCEMFYHTMNLFGYEEKTLTDLSKIYKKSIPAIFQYNKRIIKFLQKNINKII